MREVRQGQFYRHFKDRLYQIVAVAEHSETGERMVVYQALYGDYRIYVRPYDMFVSEVDHEKYPEVKQKYRFEQVAFERQETQSTGEQRPEGPEQPAEGPKQKAEGPKQPAEGPKQKAAASGGVNPILLEFLDADTLEEKIHILSFYRNKMDEALLNSIAISLDVVVEKEGVQQKYDEIMNCLSMMEKFECNRFR